MLFRSLEIAKQRPDKDIFWYDESMAMRFQVSSIPMLVVFKDGKAITKSVGYRPKSEIAAMVEGAR